MDQAKTHEKWTYTVYFTVYSVYKSIIWVEHLRNNKNNIINCFWQSICQLDCHDSWKQNQQIDHSTGKAAIKQQCKHCCYSFLDLCWYILICLPTIGTSWGMTISHGEQLPNLSPGHQISFFSPAPAMSLKQLLDINRSKFCWSLPSEPICLSGGKPPWRFNPTSNKKRRLQTQTQQRLDNMGELPGRTYRKLNWFAVLGPLPTMPTDWMSKWLFSRSGGIGNDTWSLQITHTIQW